MSAASGVVSDGRVAVSHHGQNPDEAWSVSVKTLDDTWTFLASCATQEDADNMADILRDALRAALTFRPRQGPVVKAPLRRHGLWEVSCETHGTLHLSGTRWLPLQDAETLEREHGAACGARTVVTSKRTRRPWFGGPRR